MDHETPKNLPPFEYKALLPPQANQHWPAHQIYDHHNHHHHHPVYWLGRAFTTQEQEAEEASAIAAASSSYHHPVASMIRFPETSLNFQQPPLNQHLNFNYQQNEEEEEETSTTEVVEEEEGEKHEEEDEEAVREYMFEKPLTPSDVGKLNRLVIPKQHAEKYFPLSGDSSDKGLLLSFEDESGKTWRFRYSYWNSSQSYVLTKGWSRFVKEKRLDAGDVVSFERRRLDAQRLFIRWRRRVAPLQDIGVAAQQQCLTERAHPNGGAAAAAHATETATAAAAWTRMFNSAHPYPSHHVHGPLLYQPDSLHAVEPVLENPTMRRTNSKRLRLFGVNLDCQLDDESESPRPEHSSSQGRAHFLYPQPEDHYGSNQSSNHKEFDFYPDVNHMRNG